MKGTQPSRRRRSAAAMAHLPSFLAASPTVDIASKVDGGTGVVRVGGCIGCIEMRLVRLEQGSGEWGRFALPSSQGLDSFSNRSAT